MKYTATVFGSTGLVGAKLIELLGKDEDYEKIFAPNRREVSFNDDKIIVQKIDFSALDTYPELFEVDHLFICLGTTIKKAGSKEKFKAVDLDLPKEIAKQAKADKLVMISSIGANTNSSNFYLKTKGEAEKAVLEHGPSCTHIVRPSMLLGDRKESRLGETIGKVLLKLFDPLMLGPLKKYRGVYDEEVAMAMLVLAKSVNSPQILESDQIKNYKNEYT